MLDRIALFTGRLVVTLGGLLVFLAVLFLVSYMFRYVVDHTARGIELWWFIRKHFNDFQTYMEERGITYLKNVEK